LPLALKKNPQVDPQIKIMEVSIYHTETMLFPPPPNDYNFSPI
jgi:hypothetical protein